MQKLVLRLTSDGKPDRVPLEETVIGINGQQYRSYAAVDPETGETQLHVSIHY